MATIQLGNTKIANKLIAYCDRKAVERDGIECNPEYAKIQFKSTRELWGKNDGVQAHHIIQSFKPDEITPELANQIGLDLAKNIANGFESVVYTHADTNHIHNHIVINSVGYEDGKKYQSKNEDLFKIRDLSDKLCKEKGLFIIQEPSAPNRYHRAEYEIAKRGEQSWKEDLRAVISEVKSHVTNMIDFEKQLSNYNIKITRNTGKTISYKHPDKEKAIRGEKLGLDFTKGAILDAFSQQRNRENSPDQELIVEQQVSKIERNGDQPTFSNVGWSTIGNNVEHERDRVPEFPGNAVTGEIFSRIREVKDRTARAIESPKERNNRLDRERAKTREQQPDFKRRNREIDRGISR